MKLLTLKQAAELSGVSEYTIKEWISRGILKSTTHNNATYISEENLKAFQEQTHVKLLKPGDPIKLPYAGQNQFLKTDMDEKDISKLLDEYRKENNVMSLEEIKKLFDSQK